MKRLKPGQLCTIDGHVFRCSKEEELPCEKCTFYTQCLTPPNNTSRISTCMIMFGYYHYPILVK